MQLVAQRGGGVNIRVGGNTQDYAVEVAERAARPGALGADPNPNDGGLRGYPHNVLTKV